MYSFCILREIETREAAQQKDKDKSDSESEERKNAHSTSKCEKNVNFFTTHIT